MASSVDTELASRSRADVVRDDLLELAFARGPDFKLPTVRDLCAQFDISFRTLEQALAPLEQRGLVRRKHGSGIYVTERVRQKNIGVVFGDDIFAARFSPYWGLLLQAVREQTGRRDGLHAQAYMDISQGHDGFGGHGQLVEDLEAKRLDGMLLFGMSLCAVPAQLAEYGVPQVVFGAEGPGWRVSGDRSTHLRLFAEGLAARKCRRVVLMPSWVDYRQPLEEALHKAGLSDAQVSDPYHDMRPVADSMHEELGQEVMQRILAGPLPDAVVDLEDDTVVRGAITALLQVGLKPGRDIQIASKVNKGSPVLRPYAADLIQVEIDPAEEVRAGLEMLETLMAGRTPERNPVRVRPVLVGRE